MPISLPPGTLSASYGTSHLSHSSGPQSLQGRSRCRTGVGPHRSLHSGMDLRHTGPHLWSESVLVC